MQAYSDVDREDDPHVSAPANRPWLLQVTDSYRSWDAAYDGLMAQRIQHGHIASRLWYRDGRWTVQSIHSAEGLEFGQWLPDGMRLVADIGLHWMGV